MRQWACVVALLLGLASDGYVWSTRTRLPIAIVRQIDIPPGRRTVQTPDWWGR
ncbi:MAG TPA: hypothetical protein VGQ85_01405 [Candidatus Limnocylindrales bacterium]|nr:hypothetical protein [Candidatus Limnocylindrales bacterium]